MPEFAFPPQHGQNRPGGSLAAIGGLIAAAAAVIIGAALAVFFAATLAVIAVMAMVLLALAGMAMKARRTVLARRRRADDGVIEARHLGGHHWVAYGWNEHR